jgi:hypothetical protein
MGVNFVLFLALSVMVTVTVTMALVRGATVTVRFMTLLNTKLMMRNMRGGSVLSKDDIAQMSDGQREILNAGIKIERNRVLAVLKEQKASADDPMVQALIAGLIARINV